MTKSKSKSGQPKTREVLFDLEEQGNYFYSALKHMDVPTWFVWDADTNAQLGMVVMTRATVFEAYRDGRYLGSFINRLKASEMLTKESKRV